MLRTLLFSPPWGLGRRSLGHRSLVRLGWPACCPQSPSSPPAPWAASWHRSRCMPGTDLRWPEDTPRGPCMTRHLLWPPLPMYTLAHIVALLRGETAQESAVADELAVKVEKASQDRAACRACALGLPSGGAVCTALGLSRQNLPQHTPKAIHIHRCCPCTHRQYEGPLSVSALITLRSSRLAAEQKAPHKAKHGRTCSS